MTGLPHAGLCCVAKPGCMVDLFVPAELASPCPCGWGTSPVSISCHSRPRGWGVVLVGCSAVGIQL